MVGKRSEGETAPAKNRPFGEYRDLYDKILHCFDRKILEPKIIIANQDTGLGLLLHSGRQGVVIKGKPAQAVIDDAFSFNK